MYIIHNIRSYEIYPLVLSKYIFTWATYKVELEVLIDNQK